MFCLQDLHQNLSEVFETAKSYLAQKNMTIAYAAVVGSCAYQMKSSSLCDYVYKDLDILIITPSLELNEFKEYRFMYKNIEVDLNVVGELQAKKLLTKNYLYMLEALVSAYPYEATIAYRHHLLQQLKINPQVLQSTSQEVIKKTINKANSLHSLCSSALDKQELSYKINKLMWHALRCKKMTQYLLAHTPAQMIASAQLQNEFFTIANEEYLALQTSQSLSCAP